MQYEFRPEFQPPNSGSWASIPKRLRRSAPFDLSSVHTSRSTGQTYSADLWLVREASWDSDCDVDVPLPVTATTNSFAANVLNKRGAIPALTYTGRGTRNLEGGAHQRHCHSCRQAVVPMSQLLCSEVAFTVLL